MDFLCSNSPPEAKRNLPPLVIYTMRRILNTLLACLTPGRKTVDNFFGNFTSGGETTFTPGGELEGETGAEHITYNKGHE